MSSSTTIVQKHEIVRDLDTEHAECEGHDDTTRDKDKLLRIKSEDSMDNFDVSESNILSSLFDGIPIEFDLNSKQEKHNKLRRAMKCVNVIQRAKQRSNAIVMATGLREPDEMRIIFTQRPLGIQIKPVNIHGFGAKISKISNETVLAQGVEESMIIIGLNNKDLLGCTFDQIMSIIKAADLPITLRLKKRANAARLPQMNPIQISAQSHSSSWSSSLGLTSPSTLINMSRLGPQRDKTSSNRVLNRMYDVNSLEPPSLTPKDNLMLAAFSVENMPSSTILSSSSDEDDIVRNEINVIREHDVMESDIELTEEQEDEYGMSYVQWNNIRLGASVIKHGWDLDLDDDEDETTFELAYDTLTRQGLNIYEIRAAIRLIAEQPEQIPPLETFKQLTIHKSRAINSSINPKFMPQQWLKGKNLTIDDALFSSTDDEDADDEEEEEEDEQSEYSEGEGEVSSSRINNIYFDTFINMISETQTAQNSEKKKEKSRDYKLFISASYNAPRSVHIKQQPLSRSYSETNDYEAAQFLQLKQAQPIAGYIDFFDDNESSMESSSSSQSIELQQAMDVIGLKSPCPDIVELYSSSDEKLKTIKSGLDFSDAQLVEMDPIADDNDADIIYSDDYGTDCMVESDEKVIDGIGVSSYICTEGADDLLDNDCLPQVMLKYVKDEEDENMNKIHQQLMGLKNSIRGLAIKTNVKSIFKKITD